MSSMLAELSDMAVATTSGGDGPGLPQALAVGIPIAGALGVLGLRFVLYSQLEYITAAMLTQYVPREGRGAVVLQCGGGTRELYYYPKNCLQVTVVGEGVNKSLMEQAGMQAGVPTLARPQSPTRLDFAAPSSVDAVVVLKQVGPMSASQREGFLQEVLRVLKPNCPLIFIEKLRGGGSPLRGFLGGDSGALDVAVLEQLKQQSGVWSQVQWDTALEGQDPHAVGVAIKSETYRPSAAPRPSSSSSSSKPTEKVVKEKQPKPNKGFSKTP